MVKMASFVCLLFVLFCITSFFFFSVLCHVFFTPVFQGGREVKSCDCQLDKSVLKKGCLYCYFSLFSSLCVIRDHMRRRPVSPSVQSRRMCTRWWWVCH